MRLFGFLVSVAAFSFFLIAVSGFHVRAKALPLRIPETWTRIDPGSNFEFHGMKPACSKGDPFYFFARKGSANNLVVFFDGGGACWHASNCIDRPTYSRFIEETEKSFNQGMFNLQNEANPFREWSQVFIPYCTGDLHFGARDVEYGNGEKGRIIHHRGFVNFQAVLKWITEHFEQPRKILVTGSSAGAYAALIGFPYIREAYRGSAFTFLSDSGNGIITERFLEKAIKSWGLPANVPDWIPGLKGALSSELAVPEMYRRIAEHYPNNQFAQYTTAHDSVQVYFYNLMLHIDRAIYDPEIWEQINPSVSERWHSTMLEHTRYVAEKASNYSYYIGSGADHTIMGFDKLYLESSAGVPFLTWLQDLLEGRSICVAPGILDRNSRT